MKKKQVLPTVAMMTVAMWGIAAVRGQEPTTNPPTGTMAPAPSATQTPAPQPVATPATAPQAGTPAAASPSVAGTQGAPGALSAADATRYILSPDDTLQITVWKEPSFSANVPVRPDGMISLSLVGDLPAAGFTPMQLSMDIAARLKKYIQDPSVTVTVLSVHPKQIFMLGEVSRVGPLTITPEMTPLQAIAAAGGLTPYAKAKSIYILRGAAGHQTKVPYNYKKALKSGDEQGVSLIPGDTIVVP